MIRIDSRTMQGMKNLQEIREIQDLQEIQEIFEECIKSINVLYFS